MHYVCGDVLVAPFPPESFDAVVSVATLHHMSAVAGLLAMAELVRPGGRVAVLGLARKVDCRTTWGESWRPPSAPGR